MLSGRYPAPGLSVFCKRDHFENDLGYQFFGIFYNDPESPGIPAQNPVNQFFIRRIISNVMVHVFDQTAGLEKSSNKARLC